LDELSDAELLQLRFCDLGLTIRGTDLEPRVERLYKELGARGLTFAPHCWLSTEWFSPDGVPGIAIPFYLAHPRLAKLEQQQVLDVEGGTPRSCMQLLRHEAAHALDSAYQLHRRSSWRKTFGNWRTPYRRFYQPRPYSKAFVQHLELWYAQSHPAEDWAETFAVWLDPTSRWRSRYRGWGALRKLEYVDELLQGIAGIRPKVGSRELVEPIARLEQTLGDHYAEKKRRYGLDRPRFYERELGRLFPPLPPGVRGKSAAAFLRRVRPDLRKRVAFWTGQYQYVIDRVLLEMIEHAENRDLRIFGNPEVAKQNTMMLLTVQTIHHLHSGHHRMVR
jgi:hypothetical protein